MKEATIKEDYRNEGDLGIVAMMSRNTQKTMFAPPKLTIKGVLAEFKAIATTEGKSSVDLKKSKIKKLLVGARECEGTPAYPTQIRLSMTRFLGVRTVTGTTSESKDTR